MRVILLDRDGVLNVDHVDYIKSRREIQVYPRAIKAVEILVSKGYIPLVVTNQSCVAKGIITIKQVMDINNTINTFFGNHIERFYICPHHPDYLDGRKVNENPLAKCDCRKPDIGLIKMAQQDYTFISENTWMVGDTIRDVKCAIAAKCKPVFVKTNLKDFSDDLRSLSLEVPVFEDLLEFVQSWV
jgi:D-glycero-D-manno-heptose 1,7-bisphosphate phosphatase